MECGIAIGQLSNYPVLEPAAASLQRTVVKLKQGYNYEGSPDKDETRENGVK